MEIYIYIYIMRIKNTMIFRTSHGIKEIFKIYHHIYQTVYSNFDHTISFHIKARVIFPTQIFRKYFI